MDIRTQVLEPLASRGEHADEATVERAAAERGIATDATRGALDWLCERRLCHRSEPPLGPAITDAGRQWMGDLRIDETSLGFLPQHVDDLRARAALVAATRTVDEEFRESISTGAGVGYELQLVPDALVETVDPALATRLYAASVAVIVRLSSGQAAARVAEELMAVALIAEATSTLQDEVDAGHLDARDFEAAQEAMSGVFALFEDDDVLMFFDMSEPADAALAGHDPASRSLGVVGQRIASWFVALGSKTVTGHLMEQ